MAKKEAAMEMFSMYFDGFSLNQIAEKFSVSRQFVEQSIDIRYWKNNQNIDTVIFPNIRDWMKQNHYTMRQFGIEFGYSSKKTTAAGISNLLRGKVEMRASDILKIRNITNLPLEEIVKKDGDLNA